MEVQKLAPLKGAGPGHEHEMSSDDDDMSTEGPPRLRLYDIGRKVVLGIRMQPVTNGVSVKDLKLRSQRRYELKYFPMETEEREFLEEAFRAHVLMFKSQSVLSRVCQALRLDRGVSNSNKVGIDVRLSGFGKAAEAIHMMKFYTSRHLYAEHIAPLKQAVNRVEGQYEALKKQFNVCRAEYLNELTLLRDVTRDRPNPEECIEKGGGDDDIRTFFDPTKTLTEAELSFVTKVVKEKLKMIFDVRPDSQANLTQVTAMIERDEGNQVARLQTQLDEQEGQIRDLKAQIHKLQNTENTEAAPAPAKGGGGAEGKMIDVLESQIEDFRDTIKEQNKKLALFEALRVEHESLKTVSEHCRAELIDVRANLHRALAENGELGKTLKAKDDTIEKGKALIETLKSDKKTLKARLDRLYAKLQEQQQRVPAQRRRVTGDAATASTSKQSCFDAAAISEASVSFGSRKGVDRQLDEIKEMQLQTEIENDVDGDLGDITSSSSSDSGPVMQSRNTTSGKGNRKNSRLPPGISRSIRQVEAQRIAQNAMQEAKKLKQVTKSAFCDVKDEVGPDEERLLMSPASLSREQLQSLHGEAEQTQVLLAKALEDATASHLESAQSQEDYANSMVTICDLRRKLRELEFQTFCAAILLDVVNFGIQPGSTAMQAIEGHCKQLCGKLEDASQSNVALLHKVFALQCQARATVKLFHSDSGTDAVKEGVAQLAKLADGKELPQLPPAVQHAVDRLTSKTVTPRAMQKKQEMIEAARRSSLSGMALKLVDALEDKEESSSDDEKIQVRKTLTEPLTLSPNHSVQQPNKRVHTGLLVRPGTRQGKNKTDKVDDHLQVSVQESRPAFRRTSMQERRCASRALTVQTSMQEMQESQPDSNSPIGSASMQESQPASRARTEISMVQEPQSSHSTASQEQSASEGTAAQAAQDLPARFPKTGLAPLARIDTFCEPGQMSPSWSPKQIVSKGKAYVAASRQRMASPEQFAADSERSIPPVGTSSHEASPGGKMPVINNSSKKQPTENCAGFGRPVTPFGVGEAAGVRRSVTPFGVGEEERSLKMPSPRGAPASTRLTRKIAA
eukprot:TRINITY_DN3769_c0_g1_i8.p1 TRINITY_DN3769_c0_g1~~TRINITY_DN3769_c0_g1_i8.p1  ORF type:complete len:1078 (-),score=227.37 TRINITY_DN3769_c0_g1_i8:39-3272(-)